MLRLLGLLLLCWAWASAPAAAPAPPAAPAPATAPTPTSPLPQPNRLLAQSLYVDLHGHLPIEQVQARPFEPVPALLARGYFDGAHWLRLVVRPAYAGERLVLRLRPSYLDALTLYHADPARPGAWLAQHSGDRVPFGLRPYASVVLGFELFPATETVYYLRLQSTSTHLLKVEVLPWQAARLADIRLGMLKWTYLAIMLWILFSACFAFAAQRDALLGWFALAQAVFVAYAFAIMGYWAALLPQHSADIPTSLLVLLIAPTTYWFHHQLAAQFQPPAWLMHGMKGLVLASCIGLLLYALGHARLALQINLIWSLVLALMLPLLATLARHSAAPSLSALRAVYGASALVLLWSLGTLLGWLPLAADLAMYGILLQGFLSALLMALLLYLRARVLVQQQAQARTQWAMAQQRNELDRQRLQEQQRFVAMLTHEIKTPLATVQFSLDTLQVQGPARARIDRALADMNLLVERCRQSDQFEHQALGDEMRPCDLLALVQQALASSVNANEAQRVRVQAAPSAYPLTSDPYLIGIVLGNLLDNALKYAAPQSAIDLRVQAAADAQGRAGWQIELDNALRPAGAPDLERVFQKYYRAPAAHGKVGSGLGLHLSHAIAQQLGGALGCTLLGHERIRFTLWLPQ
ncbi:sensor histidine kinase [Serpentinimonas barnesii]|uniref:sensor histidine kinase n=1 Tax=Serpentinimonas barnesii TaxID=1458427 RepID=UPI0004950083|nr:7TM-DISM domain-containing protein [Serpentinimonas barnesii]